MRRIFLSASQEGITRAEEGPDGAWQMSQPFSCPSVACLAVDPQNSKRVYAGTREGILVSNDGGRTWKSHGLEGVMVQSLAVSPYDARVLYAGTRPPMVFRSDDGGRKWRAMEGFRRIRGRRFWVSPAEPFDGQASVMALALSPIDPDVVVASIGFGALIRSEDGGHTWSNHRKGALRNGHTLVFHARDGRWVYQAGRGGAAVSQDGGCTWMRPKDGLDLRYGWACAADPERPEVWYVSAGPAGWKGVSQAPVNGAANSYIYRKAGGAAWEKLGGGLPQPMPYLAYTLLTAPNAPGHVYAGLSSGEVWHSTNYGDTWQRLPFTLGRIWRMVLLRV